MRQATFARLSVLCVLFLFFGASLTAQSGCDLPEFDYDAELCPNETSYAVARWTNGPGGLWDSYRWEVIGGPIVS